MAFQDIVFPTDVSYGSRGGPMFKTTVVLADSGAEQRIQHWSKSRYMYDVSYGVKKRLDMINVMSFFKACKGRLHSFRYQDWSDYTATGEALPDAASIQLQKTYSYGAFSEVRKITKPINNGSFKLYKNGVLQTVTTHYTINYNTGVVTIVGYVGGATYTWDGQFHVHCRFDVDMIQPIANDIDDYSLDNVTLVEILE